MSTALLRTPGALCAALLFLPAARAAADEPPRYRLRVGQELTYRVSQEFHYASGLNVKVLGSDSDWHVHVVRRNADGGWHLVIRESKSAWSGQLLSLEKPRKTGLADTALASCDLFADGRLGPDASPGQHFDPTGVFPRLPDSAAAAEKGWEGVFERDAVRTRYTRDAKASVPGKAWVFTGVRESPLDKIYLSTSQSTYTFDPGRGLVVKAAGTFSQGYGFNGKGTGSLELRDVKEHTPGEVARLAADADRYFTAAKAYEELTTRASKQADAKELLAKAEAVLKDVRGQLTDPDVKAQADALLLQHERTAKYYADSAAERAAVLGKPAAEWAAKDLGGKPVGLKDLRGKVVVLDFWYRGCGWCIRAMPQVAALADEFRGRPVAVFGMCTDNSDADARFVVEKMGIRYPVLMAPAVPEKYHVSAFPTLVVIDGKGVVRDVHVGYSPTLREEVSEIIRKLLAEEKGGAAGG